MFCLTVQGNVVYWVLGGGGGGGTRGSWPTASVKRQREMNAGSLLAVSMLFSQGSQPRERGCHSKGGFSLSELDVEPETLS